MVESIGCATERRGSEVTIDARISLGTVSLGRGEDGVELPGKPFPPRRFPGLSGTNRLASAAMTRDEVKRRVFAAIDRRAEEIVALGERIRRQPEMGFKEVKTAGLVQETLGRLGMAPRTGLAMTGVRAEMAGRGGDGPTFALIGELDGLRVTGHPEADPTTGAAHACGHNAQIAGMLGAAMGLVDAGAFERLTGRVVFFGVPAEEGGDIEWRQEQIRAGRLEFPC